MQGPWWLNGCCTHHIYVGCADWQTDLSRGPEAGFHLILLLGEGLGRAVCLMCQRMVSFHPGPQARGTSILRILENGSEQ